MFSQGVGSQHQPNPQPLNLFGSQRTTNLFGPQQPTNLFGNQQSTSLFGHQQSTNNLFGTQQSNPQTIQQLPLVAQPATGIPYPKDTKFSDLNDSMRNSLETVEKSLRTLFDLSAALSAREYNHTESLAERISSISKRVSACEATNEACRSQLASAKRIMNGYWRYGETVARAVVACKPQLTPMASKTTMDSTTAPFIAPSIQTVELLEEIVSRMELQATDLVDAAKALNSQMDQIDSLSTRPTSDLLKSSIRSQFDLFVALSARIGSLQEDLDLLRKNYRQYIGKLRGDLRDPFVQPQRNSSKLDIITNSNTCPTPGTQIAPSKPLINNNPGGNSSFMNNPYNMPNTGGLQNSSIKNSQNTNHQTSSLNSLNFPSATTNVPVPSLSSKPSSSTNFTWGSNSNTITNGNLQTPANFLFNPNK